VSITTRPTIGSLCSGYGGLEIALREIFRAEPAWLSELPEIQDTAKSKPRRNACLDVLAHHYPGVPNLGDLDLIDWQRIERTTIFAAGFPCQPASAAGRQLGDKDPRWKWPGVRAGILAHRPPIVVLENVQNLVSIAGGALWRGILDDLRAAGYAVAWGVFGACLEAVQGCHHRHRVFLLGRYVGADREAPEAMRWPGKACGVPRGRGPLLASPMARDGNTRGEGDAAYWAARGQERTQGAPLGAQIGLLFPSPSASSYGNNQGGGMGRVGPVRHSLESLARIDAPDGFKLLPTPRAVHGRGQGADVSSRGEPGLLSIAQLLPTPRATDGVKGGPNMRGSSGDLCMPSAVQPERFGQYAWAVSRWTGVHSYPPEPTEVGPKSGVRLAPAFPEWMMGLPAGHVTDHAARNDALRIIGNGVMPQQAVAALRVLIAMFETDIHDYRARNVAAERQVVAA
jgi:DNA (cytosine-5)-methyltransferase 1